MRLISILIILLICTIQLTFAQNQPILRQVNPKFSGIELREDLKIKTDLNFNAAPQLVAGTAQQRNVQVMVRNTGPITATNFVVEVTYNWRVDHESFTAQSLQRIQTVGSLAAGQQTQLQFVVPDQLIRRNAPYGSPNVNLSFKVDATGVVAESSENNNSASISIPIINN
ncbi:CARDB domain-containing protein [Haliscomenobacter hydrossis]|uniref:CARDB domain-containing protein n=1 Tax=Haliscomenobacter hydrossis (strain ATCC 27775 / DSM 1100 / LMG 10767 / O) TaxID=760192 RepID=F4KSZ7_HALH1|nr:CARDB domain-containing protein [Haliscomenobacter hydrossis]AEE49104.1 hypothetical protein Halhy_1207 [Haliscomenobacter hydrossis DSM 1100]